MAAESGSPLLNERARAVAQLAREASESDDPATLERLEQELGNLKNLAREGMQAAYRRDFAALAAKLEGDEELTDHDRRLLAVVATGAASVYLDNENDLDAWRTELRRLADLLEDDGGDDDLMRYLQVQATVDEAMRVAPDLRFFLQEGDRLKRFESATETIDPEERKFLARLIRDKLSSFRR